MLTIFLWLGCEQAQTPAMAERWLGRLGGRIQAYASMAEEIEKWESQPAEPSPGGASVASISMASVNISSGSGAGANLDATLAAEEEHPHLLHPPSTLGARAVWALALPMLAAFAVTVPDVRRARWRAWFPLTMLCVACTSSVVGPFCLGLVHICSGCCRPCSSPRSSLLSLCLLPHFLFLFYLPYP